MRRLVLNFPRSGVASAIVVVLVGAALCLSAVAHGGTASSSSSGIIANGAGRTLVQGGTGGGNVGSYPAYTPVLTTLAFHAAKSGGLVTGSLDCLAVAPESTGGSFTSQSAQFTVNVMYVTGQVTAAVITGGIATLTGTATVTGLGAGTNMPFTLVVQSGGPGATAVLTVSGLTFNEVLLDGGLFQVGS